MAMTRVKVAPPPKRDTAGWLTREQASDMMRVSYATIQNWERRGFLHPEKALRGKSCREVIVYDPNELNSMPRRVQDSGPRIMDPGELHAKVFAMLDAGKPLREIVIELRIAAYELEHVRESWLEMGGFALVVAPEAKADLEAQVGAFETIDELCLRVRERVGGGGGTQAAGAGGAGK